MNEEKEMVTFEYKGKKYITINGKDYFLIRGYREGNRWKAKWIFLQVYGKTPLHPEDLPDESWELIKTKVKTLERKTLEGKSLERKLLEGNYIYTVFKEKFFDYDSIQDEMANYKKIYFIGMGAEGGIYLVLNFLSKLYRIVVSEVKMKKIINQFIKQIPHYAYTQKVDDEGNSNIPAYYVEFDRWKMHKGRTQEIFNT